MRKLFFEKGDVITCEEGHKICEIAFDCYYDDGFDENAFINFEQYRPEAGSIIEDIKCYDCDKSYKNGKWIRKNFGGIIQYHIEGKGWTK